MNILYRVTLLTTLGMSCGDFLISSSPKSFADSLCDSLFSCIGEDDILDGMGFDNKRSCQDTISALIDKERWGDYLSSLESTETKECFKSLKAQPKDSCDERSMDVKDWADSIDFNECDAVYLFPVVGEWNGSCTNPATGEVRGFSLDIEVSSGEVEGDSWMTIISPTGEETEVHCDIEFESSASDLYVSQFVTSVVRQELDWLSTEFSCDNGDQFLLPLIFDEAELFGYCDSNNEVELRLERDD